MIWKRFTFILKPNNLREREVDKTIQPCKGIQGGLAPFVMVDQGEVLAVATGLTDTVYLV